MGKNYYLKDRDILDQALEHSWGKSAEAKAKEKAYNREYYQRHKEEILRKARQAGEGIQRTAQNVSNDVRTAFRKDRKWSHTTPPTRVETSDLAKMNSRLRNEGRARYNEAARNADELSRYERNYRQGRAHNPAYTREYNEYIGREANRAIDESNRAYKNASRMAKRASSSGAAANEASKAFDTFYKGPYEKRFDSKLARDAQNAYSKLRNPKEMARRAGESARDYIDTATGKKGRRRGQNIDVRNYDKINSMNTRLSNEARERYNTASNDAVETARTARNYHQGRGHNPTYNKAYDEYLGRTANDVIDASNRAYKNQRRMANRSAASGAALNEATKARDSAYRGYDSRYDNKLARDLQNTKAKARGAMSKAEKAAQQAREDAKKRMKKWFNR